MDCIQEAIALLSVKDRMVIQGHLEGLGHRDIGERLGISVKASMNRLCCSSLAVRQ